MPRRPSGEAEAQWRARLEARDASGLSLRAFAQREGFNAHTFWMWKKRLRATTPATTSFASVVLDHARPQRSAFELVVGRRPVAAHSADFDEAALARLVALLGRG